jgi:branched-chain amino acid transport system permease protein
MAILKRLGFTAIALVVLLACSFLMPIYMADLVYRVVMLCGIAIIMAVSLNIINGFTGQFSIGHAGFQAVGAYSSAALTVYAHNYFPFNLIPDKGDFSTPVYTLVSGGAGMLLAMLFGGLFAAGIGYLVGLPSLRLRGDYLAIVTLGFGEIIRVVVENLDIVGGPRGFSRDMQTGVQVPALTNFFWVYGTVLVVILVARNLRFSVYGLSFLSVREDEIAAQAMGVNTTQVKVKAFVLGAFFAGVAGVLFAHYERTILISSFSFIRSFDFVTMVVLGGLGSITGATLAAIVLTALPEILRSSLGPQLNQYRLVAYALLLVILMLVRPQGIFGRDELRLPAFLRKRQKNS